MTLCLSSESTMVETVSLSPFRRAVGHEMPSNETLISVFIVYYISTPLVQVRRTKVATIWDKFKSNVSLTKLLAVAAGYIDNDAARREGLIAVAKTTYLDEDGDEVNASFDDELKDAFLQVLTVLPVRRALIVNVKFPKAMKVQTKRIKIKNIEPSNKANMADLAACLKKFQDSHGSKSAQNAQVGKVEPNKKKVSENGLAQGAKKMSNTHQLEAQNSKLKATNSADLAACLKKFQESHGSSAFANKGLQNLTIEDSVDEEGGWNVVEIDNEESDWSVTSDLSPALFDMCDSEL